MYLPQHLRWYLVSFFAPQVNHHENRFAILIAAAPRMESTTAVVKEESSRERSRIGVTECTRNGEGEPKVW